MSTAPNEPSTSGTILQSTRERRAEHSWDWILCPPLWPVVLLYSTLRLYQHVKHKYQEIRLRSRLRRRGRFIDKKALAMKLSAGEGTLIIEVHSHPLFDDAPRDCAFLWWTSDDLSKMVPVSLPPTLRQALDGIDHPLYWNYVKQFSARYVHDEHGVASLTTFPKPAGSDFAKAKVVTLLQERGSLALLEGDYFHLL